jgi:cytochrome P450
VAVAIAAANRDPWAFAEPEPDQLDLGRAPAGHLGFGYGPHFCRGFSLARVQTEVALTAVFDRFPGLALAATADDLRAPTRVPGGWYRCPPHSDPRRQGRRPVTLAPALGDHLVNASTSASAR